MNETDQLLKDLETDSTEDPFSHLQDESTDSKEETEEKTEVDADDPEKQPESVKDRRHRRLEEKLRAERESNIQLQARLEAIAEAKKAIEPGSPEYLKAVERLYGTDSPEALAATELLKNTLLSIKEDAKREALEEIREERRREQEQLKKEETALDSMLEDIEDEYGTDLTSARSEATRKGFFKLLEKMSPKDEDGNIIAYADHHAVWEAYQAKVSKKPESRAKDLAARTTVQSGASAESTLQDDATVRFLRENNLI
jgi:hypothetical protein